MCIYQGKPKMRKPTSASEFAAQEIRKAILNGELKPEERIQQHALAAELGVSHVPLREAIQKLEMEGFLELHPRRGAFVMPLNEDDVTDIFYLRKLLESDALETSIHHIDSERLKVISAICESADEVKDIIHYGELNTQFHRAIYSSAGRPRQLNIIEGLWKNAARYSSLLRLNGQHFEQSQSEHWALVKAISRGDVEEACSILDNHLTSALDEILSLMKK